MLIAVALAVVGLTAAGCGRAETATVQKPGWPDRLRVGLTINEETVESRKRFDHFGEHLEKHLRIPVEVVKASGYGTAVEAMRAGKIDIVGLGPFAYLIANEKAGALPLVCGGTEADGPLNYRSLLIVPPASPLKTPEDLKAAARSLTLAWADPASTSGHLVPRAFLESLGMDPEKDFARTLFTNSHSVSVLSIKAGRFDVAAVDSNSIASLVKAGRIQEDEVRVIWRSEPITASVLAIRGGFPEEFRRAVQQALVAFPREEPEAWATWSQSQRAPGAVWVAVEDAQFDGLRELARSVKGMRLLE